MTQPDVRELISRLPYIASVLEANADKFAVPDHISAKVATIRGAASALESQQARIAALEEALRAGGFVNLIIAAVMTHASGRGLGPPAKLNVTEAQQAVRAVIDAALKGLLP